MTLAFAFSSTGFAQGTATENVQSGQAASRPKVKVLAETEKLRIYDAIDRPGDISPMTSRPEHVAFWVTGGSLERTFADGSKEAVTGKAGEVTLVTEKRPYSSRNTGEIPIHLIEVWLK
jgi:mannose-6-phosphate isomerase-like protein (cupin superfamily)